MPDAVASFAVRMILGMGLALCVMPRKDVATAFFRIMLLVVLGLAVLFTLTATAPIERWGCGISLCVVAFAGSVCWLLERRGSGSAAIGLITALALVDVLGGQTARPEAVSDGHLLSAASTLASSATLGAAMTGMLLGHRYLTAPGMPLAPLIRLNGWLGVAAIFRFLVSAIALASGSAHSRNRRTGAGWPCDGWRGFWDRWQCSSWSSGSSATGIRRRQRGSCSSE